MAVYFVHTVIIFFVCTSQRFYKKAAAFVLRAVAKHSPELAQSVVDCGALDALVICLEEFDPGVKEAAAWALGYVARHNAGVCVCVCVCVHECSAYIMNWRRILQFFYDADM